MVRIDAIKRLRGGLELLIGKGFGKPIKCLSLISLGAVLIIGCAFQRGPGSEIDPVTAAQSGSEGPSQKAVQTPADTGPVPPPPPAGAFLAQVPPDIAAELESLEIPVAVPTYLPEDFDLVDYGTGKAASGPGGGPFYWLVYRDDQNRCFTIEYTSGGIGGTGLSQQLAIDSPLFGPGYSLYHGQPGASGAQSQSPESDLFSDWLEGDQGFYRLVGAQLTIQTYEQKGCQDLPPEEALKVVESLTYLQAEFVEEN